MAINATLRRRIRFTAVAAVAALGTLGAAPVTAYAATPAPAEVQAAGTERPPFFHEPIVATWAGEIAGTPFTMQVRNLSETTFRGYLVDGPEAPGCVLLDVIGQGFRYTGTGFPANCDGTGSGWDAEVRLNFNATVMTLNLSGHDEPVTLVLNRTR